MCTPVEYNLEIVEWRMATSAGKVMKTPALPGGGTPNPSCANFTPMAQGCG